MASDINLSQPEKEELERLRRDVPDLLRLRNEVRQLRRKKEEDKQAGASQVDSAVAHRFIPTERMTSVGFATPEAALLTFMAASTSGNYEQVLSSGVPLSNKSPIDRTEFENQFRQAPHYIGMQIIAKKVVSDEKVDIQTLEFLEGKAPATMIHHMVKIGTEWRYSDTSGSTADWWDREGEVQLFIPE